MLKRLFMNAIRFAVSKKDGAYIDTSLGPANVSEPTRFNLLDLMIVTLFVATVGGFTWLLLR